jgi:hypothetical protein
MTKEKIIMQKNQQIDYSLMFFFVAFIVILLGLFSKLSFQKGTPPLPAAIQDIKPTVAKLKTLNYNIPIVCDFVDKDTSISAQMEGSSIAILTSQKSATKKIVVEGDCVYSWIEKEKTGKKQCGGVRQYLTVGKQLLASGVASADSLGTMAKQMGKSLPVDIESFMESCKNVSDVKKELFVIPKNVMFR